MAKKKAAKSALVYLVLDKSGSMEPIRKSTIEGVGRFISETQQINPDALFSLLMFDNHIVKPKAYTRAVIRDIEPIDGHLYHPGGGTALLDAVGHAMTDIESLEEKPDKVVVVVMTDGQENGSHEYTREAIKSAIERHEKEDGWQFIFLGANIDAFAEAGAIGVARAASSVGWTPSAVGTAGVYMMASTATNAYLSGATATADVDTSEYTLNVNAAEAGNAENIAARVRSYKDRRSTTSK